MKAQADPLGGIPKEAWDNIEDQIAELAKDKPPYWEYGQMFILDENFQVHLADETTDV